MRALVMAAGLGTRMRPLTETMPKPLIPVAGKPMIAHVLAVLARHGITEARVNVHHFPDQMRAFIKQWNVSGSAPKLFEQDESALILDSGGAIALASAWLFEKDGTAMICNADAIAEPDLGEMIRHHERTGAACTLSLVSDAGVGTKYTGVRRDGDRVTGFEKKADPALLHFFGYYLVNASCTTRLPPAGTPSPVMDKLWKPLVQEGKLGAWVFVGEYLDVGNLEDLARAEGILSCRK